jgi:hypothetical protein
MWLFKVMILWLFQQGKAFKGRKEIAQRMKAWFIIFDAR